MADRDAQLDLDSKQLVQPLLAWAEIWDNAANNLLMQGLSDEARTEAAQDESGSLGKCLLAAREHLQAAEQLVAAGRRFLHAMGQHGD